MIALCPEHHEKADRGVFTKARLHELKSSSHSANTVRSRFDWEASRHLVRIGGCYVGNIGPILVSGNEEIIGIREGAELKFELSFTLRDSSGRVVAVMQNNSFLADPRDLYDLSVDVGGTRVKIRFRKRGILLDLSFNRITPAQLDKLLIDDARSSYERADQFGVPFSVDKHARYSPVGTHIRSWGNSNCMDSDGRICLLDFRHMVLYRDGTPLLVRDGIEFGPGSHWRFCGCIDSHFQL